MDVRTDLKKWVVADTAIQTSGNSIQSKILDCFEVEFICCELLI